jgi:putative serine protease PepD
MTDGLGRPKKPDVWWSEGASDPWRNPETGAVIVSRSGVAEPPPEPQPTLPALGPSRSTTMVALIALITGLLAGGLGGAIGYVAATRGNDPGVVIGGGSPGAVARPPDSVSALVKRVMPSVVTVRGVSGQAQSIGSGFIISAEGYLMTNEHVIVDVDDTDVTVTFHDFTTAKAEVVGRDPESDLAVLKVDRTGLRPVTFGDSDAVEIGDPVVAIGSPLALPGTVTAGIVSALDRTIETHDAGGTPRYYAAIQTDAAVNRGSSGGPLFDLSGNVIGVNSVIKSMVETGEEGGNIGIAFAIPINQASRIASDLIDRGKARRTVIGAQLDDVAGAGGARLRTVEANGPAAVAGMRTGDIIVRFGSHLIDKPQDLIALIRRYDPGTVITVTYRRGAETESASVTLVADSK